MWNLNLTLAVISSSFTIPLRTTLTTYWTPHLTKSYKVILHPAAGIVTWCFRQQALCLKLFVFISSTSHSQVQRWPWLKPLGFSVSCLPVFGAVLCCWVFLHLLCVWSFTVALGLWSQWTCEACVRMSQTAFSCWKINQQDVVTDFF